MEDALKGEDVKKWEIAMHEEYNFLVVNNTCSLVPLPKGRKRISCKWVFKIKHGVDGEVECYKACGKRFHPNIWSQLQRNFCTHYIICVHWILAITTIEDMEIHQMDVKITFFNGDLKEDIYMEQPEGFTHEGEHFMCKLHKSLYDL